MLFNPVAARIAPRYKPPRSPFSAPPPTVGSDPLCRPAGRVVCQRREALKERREELGVQEDLESFDIKAKAREEAKAKADELVQVDFEDGHTQASLCEGCKRLS